MNLLCSVALARESIQIPGEVGFRHRFRNKIAKASCFDFLKTGYRDAVRACETDREIVRKQHGSLGMLGPPEATVWTDWEDSSRTKVPDKDQNSFWHGTIASKC